MHMGPSLYFITGDGNMVIFAFTDASSLASCTRDSNSLSVLIGDSSSFQLNLTSLSVNLICGNVAEMVHVGFCILRILAVGT